MKPLYWTRIQLGNAPVFPGSAAVNGPLVWDKVQDLDIKGEDLEDLFGKAQLKSKDANETKVVKIPEKVAKVIDGKKSQNLGIFLRSNKIDVELVRQILYDCDTSLEVEALLQLQALKATEEELSLLEDHVKSKPDMPLDVPDQFLFEMSKLHMVDKRLECLVFQSNFSTLCGDISGRIDYVKVCCNFLLKDERLRNVLAVILGKS